MHLFKTHSNEIKVEDQNVVLVNQVSGFLVIDDLNAYCHKYCNVHLICGSLAPEIRTLNSKVKVEKICRYDKSSSARRLITWAWGSLQIFFKLLTKYRGWLIVYYTNPPFSCFSSLLLSNKFRIVEYDIYPDALNTIGIKDDNIIYKLWARAKMRLYRKADKVFTLSEGMKELLTKYGPSCKIKVVPLWAASEEFKPVIKKDNIFIKANGLDEKFVVLYSGNIGYTHSVEVLIDVAKLMSEDKDVQFVIIGEGKKKRALQMEVAELGLTNVIFLPFQDSNMLPYSLASADIGVVTLDENVAKVSVPSKTYNLLAVGAPLLAIANNETEMFRLIGKYQNGRCIPKNQTEDIARYINEMKNNPTLKMLYSQNSLSAAKNYSFRNAEMYLD